MSALASVTASTSTGTSATTQTSGSELDREAFMLLLVTQFQYQDPLNPMEDKEFIAQLAQFSSLEQMMNLNESMEGLTTATKNQEMINATSYIGKNIDMTGNTVSKATDATTKETTVSGLRYALGETAVSATVNVFDSNRQIVASYKLPAQAPGTHEFNWDGLTSQGTAAPDGNYTVIPVFLNAEGESIQYDSVVDGLVNGVITDNGITYLQLADGRNTALADVRRVSEPRVVDTTTAATDNDADEDEENNENSSASTESGVSTETTPETNTETSSGTTTTEGGTTTDTGTGTETTTG